MAAVHPSVEMMKQIQGVTVSNNERYVRLLSNIIHVGSNECSRSLRYKEIPNHTVSFDMREPFINNLDRKANLDFAVAEAYWILTGGNHIFHKNYAPYSDNGVTLAGAYGPKIVSQIEYVINTLRKDPGSRQAVMTIWERNPQPSKDIPCTIGLQFRINESGRFNTTVFMRSSDAWLGIPYDLFSFCMLSYMIMDEVGLRGIVPGRVTFMLGSSHIYDKDIDRATAVVYSKGYTAPLYFSKRDLPIVDRLRDYPNDKLLKGEWK